MIMNAMTCYAHDLQCKCLRNTGVLQAHLISIVMRKKRMELIY
jgi:hypothetical protein